MRLRNRVFYAIVGLCALSYVSFLHQDLNCITLNETVFGKAAVPGGGSTLDESLMNVVGTDKEKDDVDDNDDGFSSSASPICRRVGGKSVPLLWEKAKQDLLQASIHPSDSQGYHTGWISALLQQLSSSLLHKGLQHAPSALDLEFILSKIEARMANPTLAPIVQVGVFGGSVTVGSGCNTLPAELQPFLNNTQQAPPIQGNNCAWPRRLQHFCDYFLGENVVKVTNLGYGGTSSSLANPVLKYRLFGNNPDIVQHGIDVIINGYGVNDNYFQSSWNTESRKNMELQNFIKALRDAQGFYRQARTSRPCERDEPVVWYVSEYLGNQNEIIVAENLRHSAIQFASEYYDFMYVNYAKVIDRFVYSNSHETLFSPQWERRGKYIVDGHFGMPGHTMLVWVMAYGALQSVVDYCNHQQVIGQKVARQQQQQQQSPDAILIPDAASDHFLAKSLPPLLDNVTWTSISQTWKQDSEKYSQHVHDYCAAIGENNTERPCSFTFLCSHLGTTRTARSLNKYLSRYTISKKQDTGWEGVDDMRNGWSNKVGVVPTKGVGSKIKFGIDNLESPVRLMTIHYMKSYGHEWNTSIANFKLSVLNGTKSEFESDFNLTGWHNQQTSVGYPFEFDLGPNTPAGIGKRIELEVTLLQGIKFKIMAIMICSR